MDKSLKKLSSLLKGLLVFWAIFALSLFLILSQTWLYPLLSRDRVNTADLTKEVIQDNYNRLIAYNLNPQEKTLDFHHLTMSDHGRIHFEEVKQIFQFILWTGTLAFLFSAFWAIRALRKREDSLFIIYGCRISLIFPLIIGFLMLLNFNWAFIFFHRIVFNNNYWIFSPEKDPIISYLPQSFFFYMALAILGVYLILLALIRYGLYPLLDASNKRPSAP